MVPALEQQYRVESELSAIHQVERGILRGLKKLGYTEDDLFNIRLALDEACINAVKHGNLEDPAKAILIGVRADPQAVRVEVQDEGGGFDYTSVLDPRDLDRLEEPGGRGLFLIQQFMDQVHFNEPGNSICMVYRKGQDQGRSGPIRKRVLNRIAIVEVARPVGSEMAQAWLEEVERAVAEGYARIILDLRRGPTPCSRFCDAILAAAMRAAGAGGMLVVICAHSEVRIRIEERRSEAGPYTESSLPDAVRRVCRREVPS